MIAAAQGGGSRCAINALQRIRVGTSFFIASQNSVQLIPPELSESKTCGNVHASESRLRRAGFDGTRLGANESERKWHWNALLLPEACAAENAQTLLTVVVWNIEIVAEH